MLVERIGPFFLSNKIELLEEYVSTPVDSNALISMSISVVFIFLINSIQFTYPLIILFISIHKD